MAAIFKRIPGATNIDTQSSIPLDELINKAESYRIMYKHSEKLFIHSDVQNYLKSVDPSFHYSHEAVACLGAILDSFNSRKMCDKQNRLMKFMPCIITAFSLKTEPEAVRRNESDSLLILDFLLKYESIFIYTNYSNEYLELIEKLLNNHEILNIEDIKKRIFHLRIKRIKLLCYFGKYAGVNIMNEDTAGIIKESYNGTLAKEKEIEMRLEKIETAFACCCANRTIFEKEPPKGVTELVETIPSLQEEIKSALASTRMSPENNNKRNLKLFMAKLNFITIANSLSIKKINIEPPMRLTIYDECKQNRKALKKYSFIFWLRSINQFTETCFLVGKSNKFILKKLSSYEKKFFLNMPEGKEKILFYTNLGTTQRLNNEPQKALNSYNLALRAAAINNKSGVFFEKKATECRNKLKELSSITHNQTT